MSLAPSVRAPDIPPQPLGEVRQGPEAAALAPLPLLRLLVAVILGASPLPPAELPTGL